MSVVPTASTCTKDPSDFNVIAIHHLSLWMALTGAESMNQKRQTRTEKREQKRQRRALARELLQQREQVQPQPKAKAERPPLKAKTPGQLKLIKAIKSASQVLVSGAAGTGKSYIPSVIAADMLASNQIDKIVLTRPNVAAGKALGHLPGTIDEKMAPWMIPLMEPISERLGSGHAKYCLDKGTIEIAPLETMRGRTFNNAFVILDEAQNCSLHELKMLVTRIGEGTQLVITGDTNQTDLAEKSGLKRLIEVSQSHNIDCIHVELGLEDIVRSGVVRQWLTAFYEEGI